MVIAAYAGCGKTYFAEHIYDAIDLVSIPYKYQLPDGMISDTEAEQAKACLDYELRAEWPGNYAKAVRNYYHRYKYVIIPPVQRVLSELQRVDIPYILCFPEDDAREEYLQRYLNRGNTEEFINIFIGCWERFMQYNISDNYGDKIIMPKGTYLTDYIGEIEKITDDKESRVSVCLPDYVLKNLGELYNETGLYWEEIFRKYLVEDAQGKDKQEFLNILQQGINLKELKSYD